MRCELVKLLAILRELPINCLNHLGQIRFRRSITKVVGHSSDFADSADESPAELNCHYSLPTSFQMRGPIQFKKFAEFQEDHSGINSSIANAFQPSSKAKFSH